MGLDGVGAREALAIDADVTLAYVVVAPLASGRRVLLPGLGLVAGARHLDREESANTGTTRTDTGLAVLALAGAGGMAVDAFFPRVYGFPYDRSAHQGVLDVLVHRMRQRLGEAGGIVRDRASRHIALALTAPLVIPDARCQLPFAERVLRALALASHATAQEVADAATLPLRRASRRR